MRKRNVYILKYTYLEYIQSCSHRAVVADVEEVLLQLCTCGHVTPLHAAPDPVRGVPHELRVVPDLVQVVRAPVKPVLQAVFRKIYSSFIKFCIPPPKIPYLEQILLEPPSLNRE